MKAIILIFFLNFILISCLDKKDSSLTPENTIPDASAQDSIISPKNDYTNNQLVFELDSLRTLEDYINNWKSISILKINNKTIENHHIESIIPLNDGEYNYFYSQSFPENNSSLFDFVNSEIFKKSLDDEGNFFYFFSNMAEFVDGEYAESFFDEITTIVLKNEEKFCMFYERLSEESKMYLKDLYQNFCVKE